MQMYPHWNARDNYRFGTKKKKRTKREKAIEASKGTLKIYICFIIFMHNSIHNSITNDSTKLILIYRQ